MINNNKATAVTTLPGLQNWLNLLTFLLAPTLSFASLIWTFRVLALGESECEQGAICSQQVFFLVCTADLKDYWAVGEGREGRGVLVIPHLLCPFTPAPCQSFCIASLRQNNQEKTTVVCFMGNVKSKNPAGLGRRWAEEGEIKKMGKYPSLPGCIHP